jgi:hypothetical protein
VEKELLNFLMEISMKEYTWKIKKLEKELINIQMEMSMKEKTRII